MPLKHSVEEIILGNGARGLLIDTPDATAVHYDVQFRAGSDYAPRQAVSQVAHIMEHMSFGPNEGYDSLDEFSRVFSKNGAYHNAWTADVDMIYTVDAALMEWERIFDLQLLAITKPRFVEENLDAEKGNVREEITGYANNNSRLLWQTMMRRSGLKRWFDADELKTIDAVSLADIEAHHKKTHATNNMRFILVGDLKKHRQRITAMLEAVPLPAGELLPLKVDVPKTSGPVFIQRKDSPSLIFNLTFFLARKLTLCELRAMRALNDIITGSFHSRIWGEARARGICYDMGSWLDNDQTGTAAWGLGGQVSPVNAGELFELIATKLQEIGENGVTERELNEAKEARMGGLQMGTETVRSLASWYGSEYYENGSIYYVDAMPALIQGTTVEEIQRLVQEFLSSSAWSFGGIGNSTKVVFEKHYRALARRLDMVG
jgi:predicted Zn-dependent peptidase